MYQVQKTTTREGRDFIAVLLESESLDECKMYANFLVDGYETDKLAHGRGTQSANAETRVFHFARSTVSIAVVKLLPVPIA